MRHGLLKEDDLFVKTWVCNRTVFKNIGFATGRVKLGATFSTACQLKNDKVLITRACPEVGYVFAAAASSCVTSVAKHRICVGCQCLKYDSVFVLLVTVWDRLCDLAGFPAELGPGFRPNLAPRPVPTGRTLKMVQEAPHWGKSVKTPQHFGIRLRSLAICPKRHLG